MTLKRVFSPDPYCLDWEVRVEGCDGFEEEVLDQRVLGTVKIIEELPESSRQFWLNRLDVVYNLCGREIDVEQDEVDDRMLDPDEEIGF